MPLQRVDPLVVGTRNDWVGDLTGRKLWEAMGTVEPHEPVDIVPEAGGRALVLAADGRVRRYRIGSSWLPVRPSEARLDCWSPPTVSPSCSRSWGLRFADRVVDVAPGTAVLQGERGGPVHRHERRLNKDGELVDLTGRRLGCSRRFPVDPVEVEVLEAGGRVWAQGGGASLELAGESWANPILTGSISTATCPIGRRLPGRGREG